MVATIASDLGFAFADRFEGNVASRYRFDDNIVDLQPVAITLSGSTTVVKRFVGWYEIIAESAARF